MPERESISHAEFVRFVQEAKDMRAERDALRAAGDDLARMLGMWHDGNRWDAESAAALDRWRRTRAQER